MDKVNGKLTVFFEEPFWVGIFERIEDGKLSVAKVTFGAEPKEADAGNRDWYKIATGVEITAGTEQAGTQREKTQEKRGRRAANV